MISPQQLIQRLSLEPHPEGGFYKRTYAGEDNSFSSILFLLVRDNFSAFHRIQSDEQWNWYKGDDLHIHEIDLHGNYTEKILSGKNGKENFQYVVKAKHWFASECKGDYGFALCGCTVVPAFSFSEFEMGNRNDLLEIFPAHQSIVHKFTRS
jgi:predicted cupin superfamily sugar epimerase